MPYPPIILAAMAAYKVTHPAFNTADGPPPGPDFQQCIDMARAVLQAIREPSEAMVKAWFDAPLELPEGVSWQDPSSVTDPYQARSDWRAMIDAALEEG